MKFAESEAAPRSFRSTSARSICVKRETRRRNYRGVTAGNCTAGVIRSSQTSAN